VWKKRGEGAQSGRVDVVPEAQKHFRQGALICPLFAGFSECS